MGFRSKFAFFILFAAALTLWVNELAAQTRGVPARRVPEVTRPAYSSAPYRDDSSDVQFRFEPYIWATTFEGDMGLKGIKSEADLSLSGTFDKANGGAGFMFMARSGDWAFNTDFFHTELSDTSPGPEGIDFEEARLDLDANYWTQTVGYSFLRNDYGHFGLLLGFRFADAKGKLEARGGTLPDGTPVERRHFSGSDSWIDPVVGYDLRSEISEAVYFHSEGDIGGFGANSDLTWRALAGLGLGMSEKAFLEVGYKAISFDYEARDFIYDITSHGPFLGLDLTF